MNNWTDCVEFALRNDQEQVETLWVKIKDWTDKGHHVVGVYYKPPNQKEPVDEAFLIQLQD